MQTCMYTPTHQACWRDSRQVQQQRSTLRLRRQGHAHYYLIKTGHALRRARWRAWVGQWLDRTRPHATPRSRRCAATRTIWICFRSIKLAPEKSLSGTCKSAGNRRHRFYEIRRNKLTPNKPIGTEKVPTSVSVSLGITDAEGRPANRWWEQSVRASEDVRGDSNSSQIIQIQRPTLRWRDIVQTDYRWSNKNNNKQ